MSVFSGIPVAIGGTDLNPAVFYGDWVIAISDALAASLEQSHIFTGGPDAAHTPVSANEVFA